jgi:hypothetical protein
VRFRLVLVGVACAALLVPLPSPLVERWYSSTLFPAIQSVTTDATNTTAVAWFDVLVVLVTLTVLALSVHDLRTRRAWRALGRVALRLLTVGAVTYLAFLIMWGLNYRREPLRQKVPFEPTRISPEAATALARETVTQVNSLHAAAHSEGWAGMRDVDANLAAAFARTTVALGLPRGVRPARPKHSLFDLYFRRAGVAGMTDPFFLETLVAGDVLPFERPQVVAHEWAHLAGITDEGEANFISWLTCIRGRAPDRYSGWLFLYSEVLDDLPRDARSSLSASLADGPRADLLAISQRHTREVNPVVSGAGWRVYDRYLKANRVGAGTASYGEVVQLVLGTGLR